MPKPASPLSEAEWQRVFLLRCHCKRGDEITRTDIEVLRRALKSDRKRYVGMEREVLEATEPFRRDTEETMEQS